MELACRSGTPFSVAGVSSLIVFPQAQRALAARRSQDADIAEITRGLRKGELEQITVELRQVSLLGPNAAELSVMEKLHG